MTDNDINSILPSTKLITFPAIYSQGVHGRIAPTSCPTCFAKDDLYSSEKTSKFDMVLCNGDLPVEMDCGIPGHKHVAQCAGILEKHFHVKCLICREIHLMKMPELS